MNQYETTLHWPGKNNYIDTHSTGRLTCLHNNGLYTQYRGHVTQTGLVSDQSIPQWPLYTVQGPHVTNTSGIWPIYTAMASIHSTGATWHRQVWRLTNLYWAEKETLLFYICYHGFIIRHNDLKFWKHIVFTTMKHFRSSQFISVALVTKFSDFKVQHDLHVLQFLKCICVTSVYDCVTLYVKE